MGSFVRIPMSGRRVDIMGSRCPLTLDRGARPTIVSTQSHVQSRTQGFSDGNQIVIRPHATEQSVKNALVSPLDSPLMQARGTSQVQMQRNRYLTTPQSAYERPSIVTGPEYKFHRSTEHKSQAVHHEGTSNQRPITYKVHAANLPATQQCGGGAGAAAGGVQGVDEASGDVRG